MIIAFEGVDGVGKSTIINELVDRLIAIGEKYVICGSFPPTQLGYDLEWHLKNDQLDWQTEAHIFALARRQIFTDFIVSNYEDSIVILDRFIDSSYVYQGLYNEGLKGYEIVRQINEPTLNDMYNFGIKVDLTFYITGDMGEVFDRLMSRGADYELKYDLFKISELYDIYYSYFNIDNEVKFIDNTKLPLDKSVEKIYKEIKKLKRGGNTNGETA